MGQIKFFHARGFLNGNAVSRRSYPYQYDGKRLDELTLAATMTTRDQVENVIAYLEIQKHCFDKPDEHPDYIKQSAEEI